MLYQSYQSVSEYLMDVEAFLLLNEVKNNLPLGILYKIEEKNKNSREDAPLLGRITAAGENILLTIMTPPRDLVIAGSSQADPVQLEEAVNLAAAELSSPARCLNLPGVLGEKLLAEAFRDAWVSRTGLDSKLVMEQRIFKLEKVKPVQKSPGKLRPARTAELDLLTDWYINFCQESLNKDPSEEESRESLEKAIQETRLYCWEIEDRPVCSVSKSRILKTTAAIAFVYTPKDMRKQGYATSAVAELSQKILEEGYQSCCLFTDLANPTSNSIYRRIGYHPVCDFNLYKFT